MPAPTFQEWLCIIGFDAAILVCAAAIGLAFFLARHYLYAFLVPAPLSIPVGLGLWGLFATMDDAACAPESWFCFTPVFVHWFAWIAGWVIAGTILTGLGFVVAMASWVVPAGIRTVRRFTAEAHS